MNKRLNALTACVAFLAAALLFLGERNVIPTGIIPQNYVLQIIECLLTLGCVPLALKFMTFTLVRANVTSSPRRYYPCAVLRILMLAVPLLLGIVLYYVMLDASMFYCALIAALAFLYVWPTKGRLRNETGETDKQEP